MRVRSRNRGSKLALGGFLGLLVLTSGLRAEDGLESDEQRWLTAREAHSLDRSHSVEIRPALDDPSGTWILSALHRQKVVWSRRFSYELQHVAVGNGGEVVIGAHVLDWWPGQERDEWLIHLLDAAGETRKLERLPTEYPSFSCESIPFPHVSGICVHEGLDRFSLVLVPPPESDRTDSLRNYRLSSGKLLDEVTLPRPPDPPGFFERVRGACEIPDTPLTLVQWERGWIDSETKCHRRETIVLLDERTFEVWSEALPPIPREWMWYGDGTVIASEQGGQFSVFSPSDGTKGIYEVVADPDATSGWKVAPHGRVETTGHAGWCAGPTSTVKLESLEPIVLHPSSAPLSVGALTAARPGSILLFDATRGDVRTFDLDGAELPVSYHAPGKGPVARHNRLVPGPAGAVHVQRNHRRDDWLRFDEDGTNRRNVELGGPCAAFLPDGRRVVASNDHDLVLAFDQMNEVTEAIAVRPDGRPLQSILDIAVATDGTVYVLDGQGFFVDHGPAVWVLCEYSPDLEPTGMWSLPFGALPTFGNARLSVGPRHVLLCDARSRNALLFDRESRRLQSLEIPASKGEEEEGRWSACLGPGAGQLWVFREAEAIIESYRFR